MKENKRTLTKIIKADNEKRWNENIKPLILADLRKKDKRVWKVVMENEAPPITPENLESTYFYGDVGTGKSVKAAFLALEISRQRSINGSIRNKALFINTVELLQELKSSYSNNDISETEIIEKYKNIDILILDDFSVETSSEWVYKILYIIVNWRYAHFKTTIYTANNPLEELAATLNDERITRRIEKQCEGRLFNFKKLEK